MNIEKVEIITIEKLKLMCSEHIRLKKGGSAVIYMDSKTISLDGEILSFDKAANKLIKEQKRTLEKVARCRNSD